ncbi:MAG: HAD-superfamily subfamily hydrolase [Actinomycetia bacterium]|nr:HAD-superfamily subfamily hydrolase [Actinomycetes bacterium]
MEAAFFDLDKTVIAKASTVAFGRPLYREGLLSRWLLLRALYAQLVYLYLGADDARLARMRNAALALTKGWHQETVRRVVRETLEEVVDPIVFEEALELIRQHQDAGRLVLIVSAAPEEIVRPLADYLGADGAIATRARLDADGRYSGELERYCYGPAKADAIMAVAAERDIDLATSYAYSDSVTDVPMLEAVGHPVAVNPDRALLRIARANEWEVRRFVKPVRLRDRVPMPNAATAAAGGGMTLAAVVAAVVVWWYLHRQPPAPAHRRWWDRVTRPATSWRRRRQG